MVMATRRAAIIVGAFVCTFIYAAPVQAEMDTFQRMKTVEAAQKWLDFPYTFPLNDCTYYVSTVLWDGGLAPTPDWTPRTSDESKLASTKVLNPGPTKAAAHADTFKNYMVDTGQATLREISWSDNTAAGAQLADVVAYDWENGADGIIDHLAIVTGFESDGYPLVSQHSPTRLNRGWSWDIGANNWIEFSHPGSRVYLIHFN